MEEPSLAEFLHTMQWPRAMASLALGMLALFLLVLTVSSLKSYEYIGSGIQATNTITVSGHGEVFAVPDTAEFSVTVQETAKDVQSAQTSATTKANAIVDYLKGQGIADADIQTTDYSVSPQYEWQNAACPAVPANGAVPAYCPPGKQVLMGYQVSETLTVKVRDTSKAGTVLAGVGGKGASQVSDLTFTIADQDAVNAQARDKAIAQAKDKANTLAQSLGVELGRVVGFNENQGGTPLPVYAKAYGMNASVAAAPAPDIQTGQNKITDDVTITYEIK
jgi:uncharacterized protein YggE